MWRRRRRRPWPMCCLFSGCAAACLSQVSVSRARVSSDGSNASHCFALPEVSRRRGPLRFTDAASKRRLLRRQPCLLSVLQLWLSPQQLFCAACLAHKLPSLRETHAPRLQAKLPCAVYVRRCVDFTAVSAPFRFKRTRSPAKTSTDIVSLCAWLYATHDGTRSKLCSIRTRDSAAEAQ